MPKFFSTRWSLRRSLTGRSRLAADDGFLLIEVIISAMLVGLIVIATLTGFDVTSRVTAEQRHRNEAAVLAAESQEALRSDPASTLDELQVTPHEYKRTVNKILYTVTQRVGFVNDKEPSVSCEASSAKQSNQNGSYLRISSTVTWPQQEKAKRPPVSQASIITPPIGSALEVDVGNYPSPTQGVPGIEAIVHYTPVKGSTGATLEATTGSAGCVIFGAIPSTSATLEILEKIGYVTTSGAVKVPVKEVTITPNLTTHEAVTLNEGGAIKAEYTYKGSSTAEVLKKGPETVSGDTFIVSNTNFKGAGYEVGSTGFEYKPAEEEQYAPKTGVYAATAITAGAEGKTIKYPRGDLFPFPSPSKWAVYAGDCTSTTLPTEAEAGVLVEPGKTTTAKVPVSYDLLNVWTGAYGASKGTADKEALKVKVSNTGCSGAVTPNNAWGTNYVHSQELTTEGHLKYPFQPFGSATLCIVGNTPPYRTYAISYSNTVAAGSSEKPFNIYLGQKSAEERATQQSEEKTAKEQRGKEETEAKTAKTKREGEESAAKTAKEKREKEETEAKTAKTKREGEESAAKTAKEKRVKEETEATTARTAREKAESEQESARATREKKEKTERETWLAEEKSKKITKAQRETKEKEQTKTRETKEKEEKTAAAKRESEEATAETAKAKRVKEESEAATAKSKREGEESAAAAAKSKRETEEKEAPAAKTKREGEEKEAATAKSKRETEETAAKAAEKTREGEEKSEAENKVTVEGGSEC